MSGNDCLRYGWRYAAFYVGGLCAILAGFFAASLFFEFVPKDMSIGAFILASILTYNRFLKDRGRLPNRAEYWSLVLLCTAIVLVVDLSLTVYYVKFERPYGVDEAPITEGSLIAIVVGLTLFKGFLGHCIFFSSFAGKRALKAIELQKAKKEARRPV